MLFKVLFTATLILGYYCCWAATPSWPSPYWNIPGDYCKARYPAMNCCNGRQDPCNVPILGTLCYCDTFCNRTENSDCCPDFFTHCEGLPEHQFQEPKPEEIIRPEECPHGVRVDEESQCYMDGQYYSVRDAVKKNCNRCHCQASLSNPHCMDWMCQTDKCLIEPDTLAHLEQMQHQNGWKPSNYTHFWGRTLHDAVQGRLGTKAPPSRQMAAIKFRYDASTLPSEFDSRSKWPGIVSTLVRDQGWCGASWAFSTASVASDRFAIDSKGKTVLNLSPQSIVACNTRGQSGCSGGHVSRAWNFLRKYGTVPEECSPYRTEQDPVVEGCKLPRLSHYPIIGAALAEKYEIFNTCPPVKQRQSLYKMQPAYRVGRKNKPAHPKRTEQDIMYEISTHGPVQASMEVYEDFFLYKSGVYYKTEFAGPTNLGFHSVKILGWGTDHNDTPYWLAANSWGSDWGEDGYFRIRRGQNDCDIEHFVVGAWSQTDKHLEQLKQFRRMRHRRRRLHRP